MVPQLLAKFIPGAGNLLALVQGIYNGLMWLINNPSALQSLFDKLRSCAGTQAAWRKRGLPHDFGRGCDIGVESRQEV
jgi:hypothetical protein